MKIRHFIYFAAIIFIALAGLQPLNAQTAAPFEGFDDYVNRNIKEWKVPGMAIAVIKDDKIVYAKGFGVRELGKADPVDEHTIFAIGSSSKAFTAACLAMLMDEGKLKWDDHVTKFLPGFQLYDRYVTREMTVRDILTHRIGLERGDQIWYATPYSREEILRRIRFLPPSSSMRSKFGYQNIMFLAAGQIIPSVTGKSWDDFVAERIFMPLGMKETGTTIRTLSQSNDVATPHVKFDDKVRSVPWRNIDNIAPAGAINSNVVDMAQWVRLQLGKGKFGGKQIVSEAVIKEMQTPQTIIRIEGLYPIMYPDAHFLDYGMGWFLSDFRGRKLVEHGGAIDGMRALVAMMPEKNVGLVILTNLNGTVLPQYLAYRIFDSYLGEQPKDWAADALKKIKAVEEIGKAAAAKAEAARVPGTKPSLGLKDYAGKYRSEIYGGIEVTFTDGKLKMDFGPSYDGTLEHWNYDTFRVTWKDPVLGKGLVKFDLDTKGKSASFGIGGMGTFTRVP